MTTPGIPQPHDDAPNSLEATQARLDKTLANFDNVLGEDLAEKLASAIGALERITQLHQSDPWRFGTSRVECTTLPVYLDRLTTIKEELC